MRTWWPAAANDAEVALPIPLFPPVMTILIAHSPPIACVLPRVTLDRSPDWLSVIRLRGARHRRLSPISHQRSRYGRWTAAVWLWRQGIAANLKSARPRNEVV